jgi:two-component system, chemotaxis family, protein-glutamate methylesterase/glutaminase
LDKLKVLVVDDKVIYRKVVADAVDGTSLGMVAHTAPNGPIALEWLGQSAIDVVLMDIFMMGQNSLDLLDDIRMRFPDIEIIITSVGDPASAVATIEALGRGAFDVILMSEVTDVGRMVDSIKKQLEIYFTQIKMKKLTVKDAPDEYSKCSCNDKVAEVGNCASNFAPKAPDLVLIASSTGGPAALEMVFKELPADFPRPILVVQHMPAEFTEIFSRTLDKKCPLKIAEAGEGDAVNGGRVLIAPGGMHMTVDRLSQTDVAIRLDNSPFVNGVRPSADILFRSIANAYEGRNILVVILTGMGNDGMQGVMEMKKKCNCYCITQDESSCVVYGMPRCVHEAGLSDRTADIKSMAGCISHIVSAGEKNL